VVESSNNTSKASIKIHETGNKKTNGEMLSNTISLALLGELKKSKNESSENKINEDG
jgi:hypothetical protein